jgi:hypothetical protein
MKTGPWSAVDDRLMHKRILTDRLRHCRRVEVEAVDVIRALTDVGERPFRPPRTYLLLVAAGVVLAVPGEGMLAG